MEDSGNRDIHSPFPPATESIRIRLNQNQAGHGRPAEGQDSSSMTRMSLRTCQPSGAAGQFVNCFRNGSSHVSSTSGLRTCCSQAHPFPVRGVSHHTSRTFILESLSGDSAACWTYFANNSRVFGCNLLGNFTPVDLHVSWKVQCQTDTVALHRGNPNDPDWVRWISDNNFFTFSSRNNQHRRDLLP